ncbi:SRPBCC family protein [Actinotalea sp. AC32]|nr:SRPBCC family protein [Actinotalea sp. AC32]
MPPLPPSDEYLAKGSTGCEVMAPAAEVWRLLDGAGALTLGGVPGAWAATLRPGPDRLDCVVEPGVVGGHVAAVHRVHIDPGVSLTLDDASSTSGRRRVYVVMPASPRRTRVAYLGSSYASPGCVGAVSRWHRAEGRRTLGALTAAVEGRPLTASTGLAGWAEGRRVRRLEREHSGVPVVRLAASAHVDLPVAPAEVWRFVVDPESERVGHPEPAPHVVDLPGRTGPWGGRLRGVVADEGGLLGLQLAELVHVEPGRSISWRNLMSAHTLISTLTLEPLPTGTRLHERVDVDAHPGTESARHDACLRAALEHLAAIGQHLARTPEGGGAEPGGAVPGPDEARTDGPADGYPEDTGPGWSRPS